MKQFTENGPFLTVNTTLLLPMASKSSFQGELLLAQTFKENKNGYGEFQIWNLNLKDSIKV